MLDVKMKRRQPEKESSRNPAERSHRDSFLFNFLAHYVADLQRQGSIISASPSF
jgi:hypothetical protein